jgi:hypothetical protein
MWQMYAEMDTLMLDDEVRDGSPHNAVKACDTAPRVAGGQTVEAYKMSMSKSRGAFWT